MKENPKAVRIKHQLSLKLKQRTAREYRSMTALVNMILSEALKDEEVKTK